jgi:hypothetical protein
MTTNEYRPSYTALVAALRDEFTYDDLVEVRGALLSLDGPDDTLRQALTDAGDPSYDPGDRAHPAVRDYFARTGVALSGSDA